MAYSLAVALRVACQEFDLASTLPASRAEGSGYMQEWRRFEVLAAIALLAGCATSSHMTPEQRAAAIRQRAANHDQAMAQWTGRDVSDLIVSKGQPLKVEALPNGKQVYTWGGGIHA